MEKRRIKKERSLSVVKQNDIVQKARYRLDLTQQKTIMYLISKLDSMKDVEFQEIKVNIKNLCEIMGIKYNGRSLKEFQEGIQKLSDKSMWVDTGTQIRLMRWLQRVDIDKGSSSVTVQFDELMEPFLLQIKERFVQYQLVNVLPMKSQYSLRLYELIKSYEAQGTWTVMLSDLRDLLLMSEDQYSDWRNFSQRVINVAIAEICNFTDLMVAYVPNRKDRKIVSLTFEMCNILEEHYSEGSRREINRTIVLDNMPAEVVAPKKMPTVKDVRAAKERQRQAKEMAAFLRKAARAKKAGDSHSSSFMPGQITMG